MPESKKLRTRLALLLLISIAVTAQTPRPCAAVESNLAAARLELKIMAVRQDSSERELAETKGRLSDTSNQLGVERNNVADMAAANKTANGLIGELRETVAEREKMIATITAERDNLAQKVARANKRWTCRALHVGCIGRR